MRRQAIRIVHAFSIKQVTMKKLYFIIAALIACVGAKAQTINSKYETSNSFVMMPSIFSYDGKTHLLSCDDNNAQTGLLVNVLNDDLNVVKSIKILPPQEPQTSYYKIIKRREAVYDTLTYKVQYIGEWIEEKFEEENHIDVKDYGILCNDDGHSWDCLLTQTLFNNDEAFEYIQSIGKTVETTEEEDRDGDGQIDEITIYGENKLTGINIVSEDGKILNTISLEEELKNYPGYQVHYDIRLYKINDKFFISFSLVNYDSDIMEHINLLYAINPGTTEIQKVGTPIKMLISPRVVDRNESINVRLSEADNAAREIAVRNTAGQTVHKTTIPAGQTGIQINSSQLSNGLNVISVKDGKNRQENCKVMVR